MFSQVFNDFMIQLNDDDDAFDDDDNDNYNNTQ